MSMCQELYELEAGRRGNSSHSGLYSMINKHCVTFGMLSLTLHSIFLLLLFLTS